MAKTKIPNICVLCKTPLFPEKLAYVIRSARLTNDNGYLAGEGKLRVQYVGTSRRNGGLHIECMTVIDEFAKQMQTDGKDVSELPELMREVYGQIILKHVIGS